MTSRIEVAEVLSFRLKVPRPELEQLPRSLGPELGVSVETEGSELVLSIEAGDSYLRFRTIGAEAILTEVVVCNDDRGLFFQRVLGPLMVKHQGDLSIRLTWNAHEKNTEGDYSEVKITRGQTKYPGLAQPFLSLPPAVSSGSGATESAEGETMAMQSDDETTVSPELLEVRKILERAKEQWAEYQRLKAARLGKK
jgi:hypothetical protein